MICFDIQQERVRFLFKNTDQGKVDELISNIRKFKKEERDQPELSLLVKGKHGIEVKSLEVARTGLNIEDNYNHDFLEVNRVILQRLQVKNDKGIVLLHGKPGTGKTSYIRYLISQVKKHIIFLPPNMARSITNPDLLSILIDHPDSVLVIEDAENIVVDRDQQF
ncbi:MAG: AAA family ATPase [Owenweeksia sp.]|nr:AAA family ATPase [Owenweeksia sp.]